MWGSGKLRPDGDMSGDSAASASEPGLLVRRSCIAMRAGSFSSLCSLLLEGTAMKLVEQKKASSIFGRLPITALTPCGGPPPEGPGWPVASHGRIEPIVESAHDMVRPPSVEHPSSGIEHPG